jgi:hypothetical protein
LILVAGDHVAGSLAAFLGGLALGVARWQREIEAKIGYYEQDRANRERVLRELV